MEKTKHLHSKKRKVKNTRGKVKQKDTKWRINFENTQQKKLIQKYTKWREKIFRNAQHTMTKK